MSKVPDGVDRDRLTITARKVLLDGLEALASHRSAITVIGAQAVYLRTVNAALRSAAFTSDGDLAIDPAVLGDEPLVDEALVAAGFRLRNADQPGLWVRSEVVGGGEVDIELDILAGASLTTGGRAARIPPHGKMSVKKVPGIEVAVVDRSPVVVRSLAPEDVRSVEVAVAGPVALLVSKAFKIHDRLENAANRPDRLVDKDAADVLRIMMTIPVREVATSFARLVRDPRVGSIAAGGLALLRRQFGGADAAGVRMAVNALAGDLDGERVRLLAPTYVRNLGER
ncbi:hypothetical protein ACIGNX_20190 [Actinosynnema sp. NPDC053489]|uniref:hypothetical protein n=1 Tax=Actinosynnema sp. NPDC053489 TaxID=3363916 RepID=UPI0037C59723